MKISVIIPAFNAERWIGQCIENVLCQSRGGELEVMVVDDGSTDRTAEIAAAYPVALLRQANQGVSAARNRGIEASSGEWLHFMDADDWINVDFYASIVSAIEATDADMAFCGFVHEAKPHLTRKYTERWLVSAPEDKFTLTNAAQDGYSCRYVFRRSLLERSGLRFEVGRRYLEDLPFTMRLVADAKSVVTVPGAIYYYKNRAGSAMRSRDREAKRQRRKDMASAYAERDRMMAELGLPGHK